MVGIFFFHFTTVTGIIANIKRRERVDSRMNLALCKAKVIICVRLSNFCSFFLLTKKLTEIPQTKRHFCERSSFGDENVSNLLGLMGLTQKKAKTGTSKGMLVYRMPRAIFTLAYSV